MWIGNRGVWRESRSVRLKVIINNRFRGFSDRYCLLVSFLVRHGRIKNEKKMLSVSRFGVSVCADDRRGVVYGATSEKLCT